MFKCAKQKIRHTSFKAEEMQLMTFNSLLMFDIVFIFFLFLVGVTCLVYYLPPARSKSTKSTRNNSPHIHKPNQLTHRVNRDCSRIGCVKCNYGASDTCQTISNKPIKERHGDRSNILDNMALSTTSKNIDVVEKVFAVSASSQCCYVIAKQCDVKQCSGPVQNV